jgi:hypothetical protein
MLQMSSKLVDILFEYQGMICIQGSIYSLARFTSAFTVPEVFQTGISPIAHAQLGGLT